MKMTKSQLLSTLAERTGKSRKEVGEMLEALVALAYKEMKSSDEKVEFVIPGLGKLVKSRRKARTGRNPKTGEEIQIPAKTVLKFRVAKVAKEAIL